MRVREAQGVRILPTLLHELDGLRLTRAEDEPERPRWASATSIPLM